MSGHLAIPFQQTPWGRGGISTDISGMTNIEQAIEKSKMGWGVKEVNIIREDTGAKLTKLGKLFVRSDTDMEMAIVGPKTHALQNIYCFNFFQQFIDDGLATLEAAGCIDGGRKVFVLAKLNMDSMVIAKDDEVLPYLLLSNSHDGTRAVRVGFVPIRIWCANMLAMIHKHKASKLIRLRHSADVTVNLARIAQTMDLARQEFLATAEQYKLLCSKNINGDDLKKYVKIVLKVQDKETLPTRTRNTMDLIFSFFEGGYGANIASSKRTYYSAYNAVNQYLNYNKGRNAANRFGTLNFGLNYDTNHFALQTAIEMAVAA